MKLRLVHLSTKLKLKLSLAIKRDIVSTTSLPVDRVTDCNAAARDRKSMVVW